MLKKTLVDAYDYLQFVVFGNVMWCVAWLIPVFVLTAIGPSLRGDEAASAARTAAVVAISLLVAAFVVGPATMGLAALARAITRRQDPRLVDFFHGFRRFYFRGAGLFAINAAVATICGANVFFWSSSGPGGERIGQLGSFVILTLFGYGMLYWILMQVYCPAFIARDDIAVLKATKKSALLVLDNIPYSALVFAQLAVIGLLVALPLFVPNALLMGLSVMLVAFVVVAFAMLLGACALDDLMQKYESADGDPGKARRARKSR